MKMQIFFCRKIKRIQNDWWEIFDDVTLLTFDWSSPCSVTLCIWLARCKFVTKQHLTAKDSFLLQGVYLDINIHDPDRRWNRKWLTYLLIQTNAMYMYLPLISSNISSFKQSKRKKKKIQNQINIPFMPTKSLSD